jgi:cell division septal protein FtsQ
VRKARRTVNLLRWTLILAVNGVLVATLYYSTRQAIDYLTTLEEFAVRRIELSGVNRASGDSIRARILERIDGNILDLDLDTLERGVQQDPWIRKAAIRRVLPNTLYVRVIERTPVARAAIDDTVYLIDSTGYLIVPARDGAGDRLPLLEGLTKDNLDELREDLRRGVDALGRLRLASAEFAADVTRLDLSRDDRLELSLAEDDATILLDPERVEQNLLYFVELRPTIDRRVGSADYIDLRWRDRISVMPANHSPQGRSR